MCVCETYSVYFDFLDAFHEVCPCSALQCRIINLLAAKTYHCVDVVAHLLMLESRNGYVVQVYNQEVLDYIIVSNILL